MTYSFNLILLFVKPMFILYKKSIEFKNFMNMPEFECNRSRVIGKLTRLGPIVHTYDVTYDN